MYCLSLTDRAGDLKVGAEFGSRCSVAVVEWECDVSRARVCKMSSGFYVNENNLYC